MLMLFVIDVVHCDTFGQPNTFLDNNKKKKQQQQQQQQKLFNRLPAGQPHLFLECCQTFEKMANIVKIFS